MFVFLLPQGRKDDKRGKGSCTREGTETWAKNSLELGPRTAAGPERGQGKERKLDWRGNAIPGSNPRLRRKGSWTGEGTKPGLKRVGDTQLKP